MFGLKFSATKLQCARSKPKASSSTAQRLSHESRLQHYHHTNAVAVNFDKTDFREQFLQSTIRMPCGTTEISEVVPGDVCGRQLTFDRGIVIASQQPLQKYAPGVCLRSAFSIPNQSFLVNHHQGSNESKIVAVFHCCNRHCR